MPWFRFDAQFDWRVTARAVVVYPAGITLLVPGPCADAAENAGVGSRVMRPVNAKVDKSGRLT